MTKHIRIEIECPNGTRTYAVKDINSIFIEDGVMTFNELDGDTITVANMPYMITEGVLD